MTRLALASFLILSALGLAGCSADSSGDTTVEMKDNSFDPKALTVDAGTEVHFEVGDSSQNPHAISIHMVGDPVTTLKLNRTVGAGEDVHFTFAAAGTYHVWCRFHGGMTSGMAMVVTVE